LLIAKTDLSETSVARAVVWATDNGADAINMSFGTDGSVPASDTIVSALRYAVQHNVILVAAAADDPTQEQGDPANVLQPTGSAPDIQQGLGLSVTAANGQDQRATFAGLGSQVSLAAYGTYGSGGPQGVLGAFPLNATDLERGTFTPPTPACRCRTVFGDDGRYAYLQGTSMAAPVVAAVAGIIRHFNPDLSAGEVMRTLKQTARRPLHNGWTADLGWGILDAGAALRAVRKMDRRAPQSRLDPPRVTGRSISLGWTGNDTAAPGVVSAGISRYEVWRSVNGEKAKRYRVTRHTSLHIRGKRGSRYSFYTVAVDKAGNREAAPQQPDARVRVAVRASSART
jgi:subtilisin family serine protease